MAHDASKESQLYSALGASSSKAGVLKAVGQGVRGQLFVEICDDVAGDPAWFSLLHADGAGTKSIVAYLAYRQSNDPQWFKTLAFDSTFMNVDDAICVNAFNGFLLSNSIARNRNLIPDTAVEAIIEGYREAVALLQSYGIGCRLAGGETADVGDITRTILIDSTLFARGKRSELVNYEKAAPGDIIIGLSSTGQTKYETRFNSGMGSNGLTLARHALIAPRYAQQFPEILDPTLTQHYQGAGDILELHADLGMSIAEALLAPTRTYAPLLQEIFRKHLSDIHGVVHCTGGGQTKLSRFGDSNIRYVKDALFPTPALFSLIQRQMNVPWAEMYAVFNMGHRMELIVPSKLEQSIIEIAEQFGVAAQRIGKVEEMKAGLHRLELQTPYGVFGYA